MTATISCDWCSRPIEEPENENTWDEPWASTT